MTDSTGSIKSFRDQLLDAEQVHETRYEEHRMNLEFALNRAERNERNTGYVCAIAFVVSFVLMFVGGSQVLGAFDPYDKDANALSVTLGAIYVLASVTWPIALAVGFSRLRPRIANLKQEITDAKIESLQLEVSKLRAVVTDKS